MPTLFEDIRAAIVKKDTAQVKTLILQDLGASQRALAQASGIGGRYAIHWAILSKEPEIVQTIIQHDPFWHQRLTNQKLPAIEFALLHGDPKIVELLVEHHPHFPLIADMLKALLPQEEYYQALRDKCQDVASRTTYNLTSIEPLIDSLSRDFSSLSLEISSSELSPLPSDELMTTSESSLSSPGRAIPLQRTVYPSPSGGSSTDSLRNVQEMKNSPPRQAIGISWLSKRGGSFSSLNASQSIDSDESSRDSKNSISGQSPILEILNINDAKTLADEFLLGTVTPNSKIILGRPLWWQALALQKNAIFLTCMDHGADLSQTNKSGQHFADYMKIKMSKEQQKACQEQLKHTKQVLSNEAATLLHHYCHSGQFIAFFNHAILNCQFKLPQHFEALPEFPECFAAHPNKADLKVLFDAFLGEHTQHHQAYDLYFEVFPHIARGLLHKYPASTLLSLIEALWPYLHPWQQLHALYFCKTLLDKNLMLFQLDQARLLRFQMTLSALSSSSNSPPGIENLITRLQDAWKDETGLVLPLARRVSNINSINTFLYPIPHIALQPLKQAAQEKPKHFQEYFNLLQHELSARTIHNYIQLQSQPGHQQQLHKYIKLQDSGLTNFIKQHLLMTKKSADRYDLWQAYLKLAFQFAFEANPRDFNNAFALFNALRDTYVLKTLTDKNPQENTKFCQLDTLFDNKANFGALRSMQQKMSNEKLHYWPYFGLICQELINASEIQIDLNRHIQIGQSCIELNKAIMQAVLLQNSLSSDLCELLDNASKLEDDYFYQLYQVRINALPELTEDLEPDNLLSMCEPTSLRFMYDGNVVTRFESLKCILTWMQNDFSRQHYLQLSESINNRISSLKQQYPANELKQSVLRQLILNKEYKHILVAASALPQKNQERIEKAMLFHLNRIMRKEEPSIEVILQKFHELITQNQTHQMEKSVATRFVRFTQLWDTAKQRAGLKEQTNPFAFIPIPRSFAKKQDIT